MAIFKQLQKKMDVKKGVNPELSPKCKDKAKLLQHKQKR